MKKWKKGGGDSTRAGSRKKILFVHNARTSFVRDDLEILSAEFAVEELYVPSPFVIRPLRLFTHVRNSDVVFCWFASWHTLLPVLFAHCLRKPSVLVTGGYDTANVPEANYGSQRGGIRKWLANTVLRNATRLIVNSEAAYREAAAIDGLESSCIDVVYHGVHAVAFTPHAAKEKLALTVGGVWRENLHRKGLLPFVRLAGELPDWNFVLVGKWQDDSIETLRAEAGDNVYFAGFVGERELHDYYAQASVYVQLSLHEGFGLSVAEAMTAGCRPLVSNAASLPEVVGEHGVIVDLHDHAALSVALLQAHAANDEQRKAGAEWVTSSFSMQKRTVELTNIIKKLCDSSIRG
ncbi:MAG: glycosyltransferase family 4 protein [Bacteroidia bacterium]|nr:glycosyltransferase family 4 protein [Bacteroidia bacterium]